MTRRRHFAATASPHLDTHLRISSASITGRRGNETKYLHTYTQAYVHALMVHQSRIFTRCTLRISVLVFHVIKNYQKITCSFWNGFQIFRKYLCWLKLWACRLMAFSLLLRVFLVFNVTFLSTLPVFFSIFYARRDICTEQAINENHSPCPLNASCGQLFDLKLLKTWRYFRRLSWEKISYRWRLQTPRPRRTPRTVWKPGQTRSGLGNWIWPHSTWIRRIGKKSCRSKQIATL